MSADEQDANATSRDSEGTPVKPKPEEMGHAVGGDGEAVEPEALHNVPSAALRTGDKMWGPPGTPEKT